MISELAKSYGHQKKNKFNIWRSRNRVTDKLTRDIGPEGIVGAKNYGIHHDTIKGLLKQDKGKEAREYVISQRAKL